MDRDVSTRLSGCWRVLVALSLLSTPCGALPVAAQAASATAVRTATNTPTPGPTSTRAFAPSPTPTRTRVLTVTATPVATGTHQPSPDVSSAVLTLEDLPRGFEAKSLDELGMTLPRLWGAGPGVGASYAFLATEPLEVVVGIVIPLSPDDYAIFDADTEQPETVAELVAKDLQGDTDETPEYGVLSGVADIGNAAVGFTLPFTASSGIPWRLDMVVFRRDAVASMIMVVYPAGATPLVGVEVLARKADARVRGEVPPTPTGTSTLVPLTPTPTPAPDAVVVASQLNVRAGPGIEYPAVGQLKESDELVVIGQFDDCAWLRIVAFASPATRGWVSGATRYVHLRKPCASIPKGTFRPSTGIVKPVARDDGSGELSVDNGTLYDGVVALTLDKQPPRRAAVAAYIRAGESFTMTGILDGTYYLYFGTGSEWDGAQFTKNAGYSRFEDALAFKTSLTKHTTWWVTLHGVVGGTAPTEKVEAADFPILGE
jgi:hypothetical protein